MAGKRSSGWGAAVPLLSPIEQLSLARAPKAGGQSPTDAASVFLGRSQPEPTVFERSVRSYPLPTEPPQTYDRRLGHGSQEPIGLSRLRPGDKVVTDGAVLEMTDRGPQVQLKAGYENGRNAGKVGPILAPDGPPGVSVDSNIEIARAQRGLFGPFWFRRQVPNGAPWDYKQLDRAYEPFGNFNYGATGREIGFPTLILDQEAGRAQERDRTRKPEWGEAGPLMLPILGTGSFGDDPVDQFWINQGARYRDAAR